MTESSSCGANENGGKTGTMGSPNDVVTRTREKIYNNLFIMIFYLR